MAFQGRRDVRIGDVWDSTTDAARGRAGVIAPVALLAFFLPGAIQNVVTLLAPPASAAAAALLGLLALLSIPLAVWGQLTVIGIATDPSTTAGEARHRALRRSGPAIGVSLLLLLLFLVLSSPLIVSLALSGIDWAAATRTPQAAPDLANVSAGALLFAALYSVVLTGLILWLGARLILVTPVIYAERLGAGAIRRSLALTRGLALRIVAVLLLFLAVLAVVSFVAQAVTFLLFQAVLGAERVAVATLLGALAAGIATTVLTALLCVFVARLHVAAGGVVPGTVPAGDDAPLP